MDKEEQTHICRRCGRKLRSEHSKTQGMGDICYKKYLAEEGRKKLFNANTLQRASDTV